MLENIINKKIELLPHTLRENQIHCDVCGGIGWMKNTETGCIETCKNCSNGAIDVCPECGKSYEVRYIHRCNNPECVENYQKKQAEKERQLEIQRIGKAEKIDVQDPFERFTMLYSDYYNGNEGYFDDWDSFWDAWENYIYENDDTPLDKIERPKYVWGTSCTRISLDADLIIEQATDDLWEGARDNCDYKSLQELLDTWCSEQSGTDTYMVDYKYAIRIPWEEYDI